MEFIHRPVSQDETNKKLKIIDKRLKPEQIKNKRPQINHKGTNYKPQRNIPGHTNT
jgi:hypothetical protein